MQSVQSSPAAIPLVLVWDAICPWCLVAKRRLDRAFHQLADERINFRVTWSPFELNPGMPSEGMDRKMYRSAKFGSWERSQQLDAEVAAVGRKEAIDFRHDLMLRTPNTLSAHRLAWYAGATGHQEQVVDGILSAYFEQGRDVGAPEVLADIAQAAGLERAAVLTMLSGDAGVAEVRAQEQAVAAGGIRGVPAVTWEGDLVVSGAQPVAVMVAELRLVAQMAAAEHRPAAAGGA